MADLPKVTLRTVAERAGVSASTASLALRQSPLIADETRQAVERAMDELGYVYNRAASNLRSQRSQTIGLLVGEITNPFYAEFTAGVDAVLDQAGRLAFLANSAESLPRQDRFIRQMREQGADGILLCPAEGTPASLLACLRQWRLPCVQTLRRCAASGADYVGPDYRLGMQLATEHLIARGCRRIAYLGTVRDSSAWRERLAGFQETLARHALVPAAILRSRSTRGEGARLAQALMARPDPPDALLCYNDVLALGALSGLHQIGRRPGTDVAVIGFDDIAESAEAWPGLTTVAVDPQRIGETAANLLLRRIAAPGGRPEQVILPPRLIVRET